ncbi:hypothetical protein H6P81_018086 [Aristolochia fimbriata]|uniref:Uncharacterized protein n=1 Tax=Aristolochia fimbriata TaxID=158543 RepID=A0AAV7E337_ARIFI|nr:hypothetical protein H6P81_018086 [Aristolochia fimbriata]
MLSPDVAHDSSLATNAEFVISKLQKVGHDVTRIRGYAQRLQALSEAKSLSSAKTSQISGDSEEINAREALELDQEDAHDRLELAQEQAQSADAKVVYLETQVEQIRESVKEVKGAVLEATRKVEEILACILPMRLRKRTFCH